ncbi:cupin domain-containing protein [Roseibacillus ishigakijimensis]|uniref:Cupin domain-containing protein n=1 Tax=Roseibacillus ishigakijimensis TaxID=454146 RepID=A0A934RJA3_9BACT|nr:cupin domain-containing protein [Roseibacillus ishigakijimensis]MBK1832454.1 cupin domain-containing protein [Roseibacillus ishigakijimensis]
MPETRFHKVQLDELPEIECCCGTTRRGFAHLPDAPASIHLLDVKDEPTCHYHQKTAEIYLVLEGEGHLELDGELIPVKPLSSVLIQPGCRHRAVGQLKIINIPVPKHDENDFFYEENAVAPGERPVH